MTSAEAHARILRLNSDALHSGTPGSVEVFKTPYSGVTATLVEDAAGDNYSLEVIDRRPRTQRVGYIAGDATAPEGPVKQRFSATGAFDTDYPAPS